MIHEVDVALRALIEREATAGTEVEVAFDAPTKDWAGRRNVPTIDVYLYDIREDLRRRERGLINEYDGDRVASRHLPPRHFKLSYLVTAWTQRPEDEHRLLSALLSCFLRHDVIPTDLLTGPLAELGLPIPVTVALPPPEDRSFADVWSALGGELKPSLDVVVSAPTDTGQQYVAGPPVTEPGAVSIGGFGRGSAAGWPPTERRQQSAAAFRAQPRRVTAARPPGDGDAKADAGTDLDTATRAAGAGVSWRELAGYGAAAELVPEPVTKPVTQERAAEPTPAKRKPPARRRRQGGISQQ
ncbi:DUF4255 domain-containing protein [Nakamurella sp. GG22]